MRVTTLIALTCFITADLAADVPRIMQLGVVREDTALLEKCLAVGLPLDGVKAFEPPESADEVQFTTLMLAVAWKKPKVVQWLLDRGANRRVRCSPHHHLMELALAASSPEICDLLREPAETPKAQDVRHGLHRDAWRRFADLLPDVPRWFVRVNGEDGDKWLLFTEDMPWSQMKDQAPQDIRVHDERWKLWFCSQTGSNWGAAADISTRKLSDTSWKLSAVVTGAGVRADAVTPDSAPKETVTMRIELNHGTWVVTDPSLPKWAIPGPPPEIKDLARFIEPDGSSLDGAVCDDNPAWMRLLIAQGLDPLRLPASDGDALHWSILEDTAVHNKPHVAAAIIEQCPGALRSAAADRAFEHAFEHGNTELLDVLALKDETDRVVKNFPRGAFHRLFQSAWRDGRFQVAFVSLNGSDPSQELLTVIRESLPIAEPWSVIEEGSFTHSSYRHRETKKEGWGIEVKLNKRGDGEYEFSFRQMTGPALAGGGSEGKLVKNRGRWVMAEVRSWVE